MTSSSPRSVTSSSPRSVTSSSPRSRPSPSRSDSSGFHSLPSPDSSSCSEASSGGCGHCGRLFTNLSNMEVKPRSVRGQGEVRSPRPALHQPQQHGGQAQVSQGSGEGQVTAAGSSTATGRSSPGQSGVRERSGHRGRLLHSNMEVKPRSVRGQGEVRSPLPALHQPLQHGGEVQVSQGSGRGQVTAAGSSPTSATWR